MRVLPVAASVVLAVLPVFGAPTPGSAPAAVVPSKSQLGRELAIMRTTRRIDALVGQAKKDRFELMVDVYRGYSDDAIRNLKERTVTVENLLDIVKNDAVAKDVRKLAAEAMCDERVILIDPSLAIEGRKEKRKRAEFSLRVAKLLSDNDKDPFQRQLAKTILEGIWRGYKSSNTAIRNCDPRDLDSCRKAQQAWEKIFRS